MIAEAAATMNMAELSPLRCRPRGGLSVRCNCAALLRQRRAAGDDLGAVPRGVGKEDDAIAERILERLGECRPGRAQLLGYGIELLRCHAEGEVCGSASGGASVAKISRRPPWPSPT